MIKLYYGNEPYCLEFEKRKIREGVNPMDLQVFTEWARETSQLAFQVPFFSERNVIFLEVEKLAANDDLVSYIKNPCNGSDLYIFAARVDKNAKTYKEIKAKHEVVECNKISSGMMKKWVMKQLRTLQASMTQDAYDLFIRRLNYWGDEDCSLFAIKNYLVQAAAYSPAITDEVIMDLVPATVDEKVFALSGYLLEGDGPHVFHAAAHLLGEKEAPIAMLSAILRTFRLAYKAKLLDGVRGKERDALLGAPSYQYASAMRLELPIIKKCMDTLQDAVNEIKKGYPGDKVFILTLGQLQQMI